MRPEPALSSFSIVSALLMALALSPPPAAAQQQGGEAAGQATAAAADSAEAPVDYRREVFNYPLGDRPNPFRPPATEEGSGPRFEDLELAGIIHAPAVGSVAVLTDRVTGKRYRLRENESLGSARVMEIRPQQVVFSVEGVSGSRREVLRTDEEEENEG